MKADGSRAMLASTVVALLLLFGITVDQFSADEPNPSQNDEAEVDEQFPSLIEDPPPGDSGAEGSSPLTDPALDLSPRESGPNSEGDETDPGSTAVLPGGSEADRRAPDQLVSGDRLDSLPPDGFSEFRKIAGDLNLSTSGGPVLVPSDDVFKNFELVASVFLEDDDGSGETLRDLLRLAEAPARDVLSELDQSNLWRVERNNLVALARLEELAPHEKAAFATSLRGDIAGLQISCQPDCEFVRALDGELLNSFLDEALSQLAKWSNVTLIVEGYSIQSGANLDADAMARIEYVCGLLQQIADPDDLERITTRVGKNVPPHLDVSGGVVLRFVTTDDETPPNECESR